MAVTQSVLGSDVLKSDRYLPMFRRKILPSSSGLKCKPSDNCFLLAFCLNRDQFRWVAGLFTGLCCLRGHIFKIRMTDDPAYERCLGKDESATYILCDCETIAYLRFRHLGHFLMETSDYYDTSLNKVLHFLRNASKLLPEYTASHPRI
jgi:hypothetical protein